MLYIVFVVCVCCAVSVVVHLAVDVSKQQLNYYYYYYYYCIILNVTSAVTFSLVPPPQILQPQIPTKQFYFTLYSLTG